MDCRGCGCRGVNATFELCGRCIRRVRDASRTLVSVLWCLASDDALELLGRLAWRANALYDGTAGRFIGETGGYRDPIDGDGWCLESEVRRAA